MKLRKLVLGCLASLAATGLVQAGDMDKDKAALLADALSAAPATLRDRVKVMDWDNNVLQEGDSQYVCFPTPKQLNKKAFTAEALGISYMLAGDEGASNTDPYASGPTADNQWIKEGPHLMIITPDKAMLDSLPTDPSYGGPYVMWKGTPYAHIMIPVGARP